jgi:glycerol-3-phosphate dehydrogenase
MGYTPHVLVVGGGVVGTGIARDLAIRGLDVTLVDRGPLAAETTGQHHEILHSGAHFTEQPTLAKRISRERQTLETIAGHCIDPTGGLLVALADETDSTLEEIHETLDSISVPCERLDGDAAREIESALSEEIEHALEVPDAVVDPVELTLDTARSAMEYGASIRTHTRVTDIATDGGSIDTVRIEYDPAPEANIGPSGPTRAPRTDGGPRSKQFPKRPGGPARTPGETETESQDGPVSEELDPEYIVNAAGARAEDVAACAGLDIPVSFTAKTNRRISDVSVGKVLTRSTNGATLVPDGESVVLGPANADVDSQEDSPVAIEGIAALFETMSSAVPSIEGGETVRTYGTVRARPPQAETQAEWSLVDHGDQDDCWGMTTVIGGAPVTHRFIAERVANDICSKFGIRRECQTDELSLLEDEPDGDMGEETAGGPLVCDCESVTRDEIRAVFDDDLARPADLDEICLRTGAAMGACQGRRCAHGIATELYPRYDPDVVTESFEELCRSRWEEQRHALVDTHLSEAARTYQFSVETMSQGDMDLEFVESKSKAVEESIDDEEKSVSTTAIGLASFDDGTRNSSPDRPPWGQRPLPGNSGTETPKADWQLKGEVNNE